MSKFEKRLVIFALVFVVIYLGAAIVTINTRLNPEDRIERLESTKIIPHGRKIVNGGTVSADVDSFHPDSLLYRRQKTAGQKNAATG